MITKHHCLNYIVRMKGDVWKKKKKQHTRFNKVITDLRLTELLKSAIFDCKTVFIKVHKRKMTFIHKVVFLKPEGSADALNKRKKINKRLLSNFSTFVCWCVFSHFIFS